MSPARKSDEPRARCYMPASLWDEVKELAADSQPRCSAAAMLEAVVIAGLQAVKHLRQPAPAPEEG